MNQVVLIITFLCANFGLTWSVKEFSLKSYILTNFRKKETLFTGDSAYGRHVPN